MVLGFKRKSGGSAGRPPPSAGSFSERTDHPSLCSPLSFVPFRPVLSERELLAVSRLPSSLPLRAHCESGTREAVRRPVCDGHCVCTCVRMYGPLAWKTALLLGPQPCPPLSCLLTTLLPSCAGFVCTQVFAELVGTRLPIPSPVLSCLGPLPCSPGRGTAPLPSSGVLHLACTHPAPESSRDTTAWVTGGPAVTAS